MSEGNEAVVTYGDLSESSDNEAIGGLLDEHTVAEGKEPILIPHRLLISPHNVFFTREGAYKHYQGAFGKVEIGDQSINSLEFITGINEDSRFSDRRIDRTRVVGNALKDSRGGSSDGNYPAPSFAAGINLVGNLSLNMELLCVHLVIGDAFNLYGSEGAESDV